MSDDRPDGFTMIGLHQPIPEEDDGYMPELYTLLAHRAGKRGNTLNIIDFPVRRARFCGRAPHVPPGPDAQDGRNVIAFEPRAVKTPGRWKKV